MAPLLFTVKLNPKNTVGAILPKKLFLLMVNICMKQRISQISLRVTFRLEFIVDLHAMNVSLRDILV